LDSWLLAAGAIVLIAITLWIVWPARRTDASTRDVEAPTPAMTSSLPPQGDRFEDQYTSATADLSAAGVATAVQAEITQAEPTPVPMTPPRSVELRGVPVQDAPGNAQTGGNEPWPLADPRTEHIGLASRAENFPYGLQSRESESQTLLRPRYVTIGAGVLLAVLSSAGGAWLFAHWQAERNKPINRLKRTPVGEMTIGLIEEVSEILARAVSSR